MQQGCLRCLRWDRHWPGPHAAGRSPRNLHHRGGSRGQCCTHTGIQRCRLCFFFSYSLTLSTIVCNTWNDCLLSAFCIWLTASVANNQNLGQIPFTWHTMCHEDYERQVKAQKDVKKFDFIHLIEVKCCGCFFSLIGIDGSHWYQLKLKTPFLCFRTDGLLFEKPCWCHQFLSQPSEGERHTDDHTWCRSVDGHWVCGSFGPLTAIWT